MRRLSVLLLVPFLNVRAAARPAAGQAWDAPSFMPSHPVDELGVFVLDPPFSEVGLVGLWRQSGNLGLGVRAGILDQEFDGTAFVVGSEFFAPLLRAAPGSPLEALLVLGAGATFADGILARIPLGVSVGAQLGDADGDVVFTPYVHPRVGLEILADDDDSVTEVAFMVDFGLDVQVTRSVTLRAAYTWVTGGVDDRFANGKNALGAGLAIRFGRPVQVR